MMGLICVVLALGTCISTFMVGSVIILTQLIKGNRLQSSTLARLYVSFQVISAPYAAFEALMAFLLKRYTLATFQLTSCAVYCFIFAMLFKLYSKREVVLQPEWKRIAVATSMIWQWVGVIVVILLLSLWKVATRMMRNTRGLTPTASNPVLNNATASTDMAHVVTAMA